MLTFWDVVLASAVGVLISGTILAAFGLAIFIKLERQQRPLTDGDIADAEYNQERRLAQLFEPIVTDAVNSAFRQTQGARRRDF